MFYFIPEWLKWWKGREEPAPPKEQELLPDPVESE